MTVRTRKTALPSPAGARADVERLSGVGWFEIDTDRIVTAVSPEMERITGFREAEPQVDDVITAMDFFEKSADMVVTLVLSP